MSHRWRFSRSAVWPDRFSGHFTHKGKTSFVSLPRPRYVYIAGYKREAVILLHTASETISFIDNLEEQSAQYYEGLAAKDSTISEQCLIFAQENRKYAAIIKRVYYSVISDALEGGYAFDIDTEKYSIDVLHKDDSKHDDMIKKAVGIEETIVRFYNDAAEQSMELMADLPRQFKIIAKKRQKRINLLRGLTG